MNSKTIKIPPSESQHGQFNDIYYEDALQSRVISSLRFPLILLVVFFHIYGPGIVVESSSVICNVLIKTVSADGIAKLAVPAFFLISGYLFFYKSGSWTLEGYKCKLKKRIRTLLVPYLLWIVIPLIFGVILRISIAWMNEYPILEYVNEFLDSAGGFGAFWNTSEGHPYIVPLWYVRDLMICCLLSPVIYFLIKKLGIFYLMITGICFFFDMWFDVIGFCVRACFFFSLGAYFSINGKNMVMSMRGIRMPVYILATMLFILSTFFSEVAGKYNYVVCNLFIFFGIWMMFNLIALLEENNLLRIPAILTNSVFFIFAFHMFPLPGVGSVLIGVKNLLGSLISRESTVAGLIEITLTPLIIVGVCVLTYVLFNRFFSRLCSVMTGGRD